jgi:hypothetical protein
MRGFSDRHLEWQADGPNNFAMNHSSCRSLDSAALEICARRTGKACYRPSSTFASARPLPKVFVACGVSRPIAFG